MESIHIFSVQQVQYICATHNLACPCNSLALHIQTHIQYTNKETTVVLMPRMIHFTNNNYGQMTGACMSSILPNAV